MLFVPITSLLRSTTFRIAAMFMVLFTDLQLSVALMTGAIGSRVIGRRERSRQATT